MFVQNWTENSKIHADSASLRKNLVSTPSHVIDFFREDLNTTASLFTACGNLSLNNHSYILCLASSGMYRYIIAGSWRKYLAVNSIFPAKKLSRVLKIRSNGFLWARLWTVNCRLLKILFTSLVGNSGKFAWLPWLKNKLHVETNSP